ncbi:MAG: hypothetical protein K9I29_07995 [Bacteroidales bacterium]|nr:hypothetical protein [Bacteroidales bacterium]MCF8328224.1 hypothetical protein [Bacteroidales bacterium]
MKKWLINPFRYVSGWPALIAGIAGLLIMTAVSFYSKTHLDGVMDVHFGKEGSFVLFLKENLLTWISLIIAYGAIGLMITGRSFRFIDLAGYTLLMRLPLLIVVFFPFVFGGTNVVDHILYLLLDIGEPVQISAMDVVWFIIMIILTIVFVFWSIIWGYFAFKTLFHTSGLKALALFFITILLAELIVKLSIYFVFSDMALFPV